VRFQRDMKWNKFIRNNQDALVRVMLDLHNKEFVSNYQTLSKRLTVQGKARSVKITSLRKDRMT
jgi:hypothetical protein